MSVFVVGGRFENKRCGPERRQCLPMHHWKFYNTQTQTFWCLLIVNTNESEKKIGEERVVDAVSERNTSGWVP